MRIERKMPFQKDVEMILDAWGVDLPEARELARGIAMRPGWPRTQGWWRRPERRFCDMAKAAIPSHSVSATVLPMPSPRPTAYSGLALLGDGRVLLLLDLKEHL
jgi:hypothetical protein